jgi:hypothetical protein
MTGRYRSPVPKYGETGVSLPLKVRRHGVGKGGKWKERRVMNGMGWNLEGGDDERCNVIAMHLKEHGWQASRRAPIHP